MSSHKLHQLKQSRSVLVSQQVSLSVSGQENSAAFKKLEDELRNVESDINLLEKLENMMTADERARLPKQISDAATSAVRTALPSALSSALPQQMSSDEKRHRANAAMRSYLLHGANPSLPEQRDVLTTSGTGFAVPQEFNDVLNQATKYFAPLLNYVQVKKDNTGRPTKAMFVDDTANGLTIVTEGSVTPVEGPDPVFASKIVTPDLFNGGLIRVANELIQDSNWDFGSVIETLAASRYYRGLQSLLTLGQDSSGNNSPNNVGLLNVATVGQTSSSATAISYADLSATYSSLDPSYLPTAYWQFNSATRLALLDVLDTTGRPVLVPAPNADSLDMLLSRPVLINQSLPNVAASTTPVLFGSLHSGYFAKIDQSPIIIRIKEAFIEFNETAFQIVCRVGSTGLVPNAIKSLKMA